tara:strand:+ start:1142 stop:1471 length:330 start_codon:yes stop_codon:yes gene_type:complete
MIEAGELRHRITVKRNTNSADGYGGFTHTQSTVGTFWGKREYLNGKMIFKNGERILQTGIEITLRKNTATTNLQKGDLIFLTGDTNEYRINDMYEVDLYEYKVMADKEE